MSSWHNRQRRRVHIMTAKMATLRYVFNDGFVINDHGDGKGQAEAVARLLATGVGYRVESLRRVA